MQLYCESLTEYRRLKTREVKIGDLLLGNLNPIRVQTMTTTDTMDTIATVEQSIRCIEAGAELVRITAPSKKEAENLLNIKNELKKRGYSTPLVADIHFTPNTLFYLLPVTRLRGKQSLLKYPAIQNPIIGYQ